LDRERDEMGLGCMGFADLTLAIGSCRI
jgi:hypothetical protein